MSAPSEFVINFREDFPILTNSPILEAVIHWQAHTSKALDQTLLREDLTRRLPDYPIIQPQYQIQINVADTNDMSQSPQSLQWSGFRLENTSSSYVAQFTDTGIAFSRINTYENWENFKAEAMRLWNTFVEIAEPKLIHRLGVRFINRVFLKQGESISTYLSTETHKLSGLEVLSKSCFYQDTYEVNGYPYEVNFVRTIQPDQAGAENGQVLIMDIDVFTTEVASDSKNLNRQFSEMRWLKNKVFFGSITDFALNTFGS